MLLSRQFLNGLPVSRFTVAVPLPDSRAPTLADALWRHFITPLGPPRRVHNDKGVNLNAKIIKDFFHSWDIRQTTTVSGYPQGNGVVERLNATIQDIIAKKLVNEKPRDWDLLVPSAVMAYNVTPHIDTGCSPYALFFGREASLASWLSKESKPHDDQRFHAV